MELSRKIKIGLYDYESKKFEKTVLDLKDDNFIAIDDDKKLFQIIEQSEIKNKCFLFHSDFQIINNEIYNIYIDNLVAEKVVYQNKEILDDLENNLWYVIYSDTDKKIDNKYYLMEGDIIRLGNSKFIINKININFYNNERYNNQKYYQNKINISANPFFNGTQIYKKCQMCQETYYIPICACQKTIHFSCFQKLYSEPQNNKNKIEISTTNNVTKFFIKNFFCSQCNCQYSYEYKIPNPINKELKSINYEPNDLIDYIILESLATKDKTVYIIYFTKDKITIGNKNEDNDIIINDESQKEIHVQFNFDKDEGKIWIENLNNDFEINILVRNEFLLSDEKILLKVKNHVFYLKQKKLISE